MPFPANTRLHRFGVVWVTSQAEGQELPEARARGVHGRASFWLELTSRTLGCQDTGEASSWRTERLLWWAVLCAACPRRPWWVSSCLRGQQVLGGTQTQSQHPQDLAQWLPRLRCRPWRVWRPAPAPSGCTIQQRSSPLALVGRSPTCGDRTRGEDGAPYLATSTGVCSCALRALVSWRSREVKSTDKKVRAPMSRAGSASVDISQQRLFRLGRLR